MVAMNLNYLSFELRDFINNTKLQSIIRYMMKFSKYETYTNWNPKDVTCVTKKSLRKSSFKFFWRYIKISEVENGILFTIGFNDKFRIGGLKVSNLFKDFLLYRKFEYKW